MRKWRNDFKNQSSEIYYDLFEDWDLVESSFKEQYGIRLRKDLTDMDYGEFISYLSGINGETALGNVVRIRSEKDTEAIKRFSEAEKSIRNKWLEKHTKQINISEEDYKKAMEKFEQMFISMAKGGES